VAMRHSTQASSKEIKQGMMVAGRTPMVRRGLVASRNHHPAWGLILKPHGRKSFGSTDVDWSASHLQTQ
jgi:hypothetical protein